MKNVIPLFLFLLISSYSVAQTTYYVDKVTGNNANNGMSQTSAWKTIQKAANSAIPNSIVYIKAGTYFENILINVSGTAGNPITFKNFENDFVAIDGTGTTGSVLLEIIDKNYLTFENLTLQNLTVNFAHGMYVNNSTNGTSTGIVIRNIIIRNIKWTASTATVPTSANNAWGLSITGRNGGISNIMVDNCNISNNILGYSEALSISGNVSGFIIANCAVHDNNNIGIDMLGNYGKSNNPLTDKPRNGLITHNSCYRNISPVALSAGIYVDGGEDITIEKNSSYLNGFGIEVGCEQNGNSSEITVKNNLIYNNKSYGLAFGGYTTATTGQVLSSTFRNNTIFQNNTLQLGAPEIAISKASNCIFEDNLIYGSGENVLLTRESISPQTNNLLNYNCWYTPAGTQNNFIVYWGSASYSSFSAYKNGTQQDQNSIYANPHLADPLLPIPNLQLLSNSACINAGNPELQISAGETDFDGNNRVNYGKIDIGAREFQGILAVHNSDENFTAIAFPNPFQASTQLLFGRELLDATFILYDVTGKKVTEIKNISGTQIVIERNNLTNGVYFYQCLEADKIVTQGKLVAQ